jgi:hypothetical protein
MAVAVKVAAMVEAMAAAAMVAAMAVATESPSPEGVRRLAAGAAPALTGALPSFFTPQMFQGPIF